jgi:hypothetical protein
MSSSSQFILKSRNSESFKRRLSLSEQATSISVPDKSGNYTKISLKLENGRPAWASEGSKYKVGFQSSPVELEKVVYPKITVPAISASVTGSKLCYFIVDKKTDRILSSKVFEKERTFTPKQSFNEFGIVFNKNIHSMEVRSVLDGAEIQDEDDLYGNDYLEVILDKKVRVFLSILLSLWFLSHGYQYVKDFFKTEVTKIQVENKEKILKERQEISKLIQNITPEKAVVVKEVKDNKPLKSKGVVKRKSKVKKVYSVKKTTKKRLKKGKNTLAATKKTIVKAEPKAKPSLQDQLFSRSLVKGSTGRASAKAATTLRGSAKGTSSGKGYGGAGTIKGGFVKGTGSSFGTKLGNRGGTGGGSHAQGGSGVGGLGAGLSLNGTGAGVSGGLTREQINRVVRRNKKDISRCFDTRAAFSPGLSGKVGMDFTINSLGRVAAVSAGASTIKDAALKNCLSRKISTWRFDKPTGGRLVKVSYPFNFTSTQGKF